MDGHLLIKKNEKYEYRKPWIAVQTKPLEGLLDEKRE